MLEYVRAYDSYIDRRIDIGPPVHEQPHSLEVPVESGQEDAGDADLRQPQTRTHTQTPMGQLSLSLSLAATVLVLRYIYLVDGQLHSTAGSNMELLYDTCLQLPTHNIKIFIHVTCNFLIHKHVGPHCQHPPGTVTAGRRHCRAGRTLACKRARVCVEA